MPTLLTTKIRSRLCCDSLPFHLRELSSEVNLRDSYTYTVVLVLFYFILSLLELNFRENPRIVRLLSSESIR